MGVMPVTRRELFRLGGLTAGAFDPVGARLCARAGARRGARLQARTHHRDPQHLPLLRGRLRHHHVRARRQGKECAGLDRPYRGRPGPPGQSRHALPQGGRTDRLRARADPPQIPGISRSRRHRVAARRVGLGARPHRPALEGRPRQELHRQEPRRRHGQPLALDRGAGRFGELQRNRFSDLQGHPLAGHPGLR